TLGYLPPLPCWYILKKKERTGELRNTKRPRRPQKTTVVDDRRILSLVKNNLFTTVVQIKNTLQEVGVSVSKSTINRRLHQSKYSGFTTRCKPLVSLKQEDQIKVSQKTSKKPVQFWNNIHWTDETKINLYQNDGKRRVLGREGAAHDPKHTNSSVKHGGGSVMVWACMAANGTGSLVFIDDVTADKSSRMNSEVFRAILFAQIQPNTSKLIGRRFTVQMDNDLKHTAKATQYFFKAKKWNVLQWPSQSPDLNPIEHAFHLLKARLWAKHPKNKQELKTAAVKAWQSITREETHHLVMSMGSRFQ
uniref:Tc1-like transposase DDE domain-containing protein n=1 Tax=Salmo trutta TaxID=8032 RepID=A0A673YSH1_SALTR